MNWLKPTNPRNYDHHKALEELQVVTWKSGARNIKKGDSLYIYSTSPEKRITHKCLVEQVGVKREEIIDDNKYVLSSKFDNRYEEGKNYVRLRLLETFPPKEELGYAQLKEHGLNNKQSMNTISNELVAYIENVCTKVIKGKNLIIYGVPGSGKSHKIEKEIESKEEQVERVIFYPEYSYFDFVGQKIPHNKKNGTCLEFEPGSFARMLAKAFVNPQKHYYLVIEELNRGKAEAIFGDIFQLLDRDENGKSKYTITNFNLRDFVNEELKKNKIKKQIEKVYIPSNLSIYASLNNADQNVFNFDTAFGRRWEYELEPCNKKDDSIYSTGYIKGTKDKWSDIREKINDKILQYREEIYNAEEKRLGLYYIDKDCLSNEKDENTTDEYYAEKFANKIFRYLYLNVFKNNEDKIFKNQKVLEDYISEFKKNKDINKILELGDKTSGA